MEFIRAYQLGFVALALFDRHPRLWQAIPGIQQQVPRYTAEASYPAYILHQTVIIIIGFYVVQWQASVLVKYATILVAALIATTLIYDLLVKRTNVTRFLFGMRLKKKPVEERAPQPRVA